MANRAYLGCPGGGRELVAKYSLPEAWCDLFGVDDLHVGPSCDIPGLCKPDTAVYLLSRTADALTRFEARMMRGGCAVEGDEFTARVYAWMQAHFMGEWLFVDLTELSWMSNDFIPSTQRMLETAERTVARWYLKPTTLGLDLGWRTGLAQEERGR